MKVWGFWEIQVGAAPQVDENTGLDPYAGVEKSWSWLSRCRKSAGS